MTKENRLVWPRLWAIRSARLPKRSAGRSRRSRANSSATGCRAGATRRFTPPEPINCAGGVKRGSKEIEPYGPSLSTGSQKGGPRSKFQAGSRAETTSPAGRGLRDDLRLHLQGSATGRAVMALSHAPSQTPPPAPVETFARYHQGSRLHPRTAQEGRC